MAFKDDIDKYTTKYNMMIDQVFQKSCEQISIDIADASPVSTGRLLGSWAPSKNSIGDYNFSGGRSAWNLYGIKSESIAAQNRTSAMANLTPRINNMTESLTKNDTYYFTNSTEYARQAEFDGWRVTSAYHMVSNSIQNWSVIVDLMAKNV
jgi:hypothetical protein